MVDKDKEIMPVVVAAADKRQQQTRLSSSFPATTLQQNQVFVNSCGNCSAAEQSNHYLLDDTILYLLDTHHPHKNACAFFRALNVAGTCPKNLQANRTPLYLFARSAPPSLD
jgi:hypothetical protein